MALKALRLHDLRINFHGERAAGNHKRPQGSRGDAAQELPSMICYALLLSLLRPDEGEVSSSACD